MFRLYLLVFFIDFVIAQNEVWRPNSQRSLLTRTGHTDQEFTIGNGVTAQLTETDPARMIIINLPSYILKITPYNDGTIKSSTQSEIEIYWSFSSSQASSFLVNEPSFVTWLNCVEQGFPPGKKNTLTGVRLQSNSNFFLSVAYKNIPDTSSNSTYQVIVTGTPTETNVVFIYQSLGHDFKLPLPSASIEIQRRDGTLLKNIFMPNGPRNLFLENAARENNCYIAGSAGYFIQLDALTVETSSIPAHLTLTTQLTSQSMASSSFKELSATKSVITTIPSTKKAVSSQDTKTSSLTMSTAVIGEMTTLISTKLSKTSTIMSDISKPTIFSTNIQKHTSSIIVPSSSSKEIKNSVLVSTQAQLESSLVTSPISSAKFITTSTTLVPSLTPSSLGVQHISSKTTKQTTVFSPNVVLTSVVDSISTVDGNKVGTTFFPSTVQMKSTRQTTSPLFTNSPSTSTTEMKSTRQTTSPLLTSSPSTLDKKSTSQIPNSLSTRISKLIIKSSPTINTPFKTLDQTSIIPSSDINGAVSSSTIRSDISVAVGTSEKITTSTILPKTSIVSIDTVEPSVNQISTPSLLKPSTSTQLLPSTDVLFSTNVISLSTKTDVSIKKTSSISSTNRGLDRVSSLTTNKASTIEKTNSQQTETSPLVVTSTLVFSSSDSEGIISSSGSITMVTSISRIISKSHVISLPTNRLSTTLFQNSRLTISTAQISITKPIAPSKSSRPLSTSSITTPHPPSSWSSWTPENQCTRSNNGTIQRYHRTCNINKIGTECEGPSTKDESCEIQITDKKENKAKVTKLTGKLVVKDLIIDEKPKTNQELKEIIEEKGDTYQKLKQETEKALFRLYTKNNPNIKEIIVTQLSVGSLVIDYIVVVKTDDDKVPVTFKDLNNVQNEKEIFDESSEFSASEPTFAAIADYDDCADENACHSKAICVNDIDTTVVQPYSCYCKKDFTGNGFQCEPVEKDDDEPSRLLLVVIIIACCAVLMFIILLLTCWRLRRQRKKKPFNKRYTSTLQFDAIRKEIDERTNKELINMNSAESSIDSNNIYSDIDHRAYRESNDLYMDISPENSQKSSKSTVSRFQPIPVPRKDLQQKIQGRDLPPPDIVPQNINERRNHSNRPYSRAESENSPTPQKRRERRTENTQPNRTNNTKTPEKPKRQFVNGQIPEKYLTESVSNDNIYHDIDDTARRRENLYAELEGPMTANK